MKKITALYAVLILALYVFGAIMVYWGQGDWQFFMAFMFPGVASALYCLIRGLKHLWI